MSAVHRDIIYVEIEAERLRQAREDGTVVLHHLDELIAIKAIVDVLIAREATRG